MKREITMLLVLVGIGLMCCSCQSAKSNVSQEDLITEELAQESLDSATLAYELAYQTWCSNDQACSMVLLMLNGEDRYQSFAQRLRALIAEGLVQESWKLNGDDSVTKGTLAYMICEVMQIKGGVMMYLLPSRRYAYREAVDRGLMLYGSENEPLTGPEVVGIVGRVARIQEKERPLEVQ